MTQYATAHPHPTHTQDTDQKKPTLRGRIWRILLNIGTPDLDEYFDLVQQGPCSKPETAELIHADVNRTFNDGDTNLKLDLNVLERVLHAFQRKHGKLSSRYLDLIVPRQ